MTQDASIGEHQFIWPEMTMENFAAYQTLMGLKVVRVGDQYWSRVRTGFYRPLWPFHLHATDPAVPLAARLGGAQFALAEPSRANSQLNLIVFEDTQAYTPAALHRNERRQIRLAAKAYTVREIRDVTEFKTLAYAPYLAFYNRTQYQVGAERRNHPFFLRWADELFRIPGVLILGGFNGDKLCGVSVSFRIGDTIDYATFFCDQEALRHHLADLMLHALRDSARRRPEVSRIYMGAYKGDPGLDNFKFHRGARLLQQPARLELNPLTLTLLKRCLPRQYEQLVGRLPDKPPAAADPAPAKPGSS